MTRTSNNIINRQRRLPPSDARRTLFAIRHSSFAIRRFRRRGTILVFVLGILTLLALVGLVMIARTHGEALRVANQSSISNDQSVLNGIVRAVQETLRRDIWGAGPSPSLPFASNLIDPIPGNPPTSNNNVQEKNEPYDAPGDADRWLASLTPYMGPNEDPTNPNPDGSPRMIAAYNALGQPSVYESLVLIWPFVSYLGTDLLQSSSTQPFMWDANSRVPTTPPSRVTYSSSNLAKVKILQTPPPGAPTGLIPGSTTSVTIAQSRSAWRQFDWSTANPPLPAGTVPQFPYFDTNADGVLDLYDADSDGIPDSPLSLVIPVDRGDASAPRQLYAAVRIVDHNATINVNTASSLRLPSGTLAELMFGETLSNLQRRGRRATELLLDEVVHPDDRITRTRKLVESRSGDDPVQADRDIVRTQLVGGRYGGPLSYFLFGMTDESSLRHRGNLVPYDRRNDAFAVPGDYSDIDRALRGTLQWTRVVQGGQSYDWTNDKPHWSRLNSNFVNAAYEGYDNGNVKGWRSLLQDDQPFAIRRPLFTTVSHDVVAQPVITSGAIATVDDRLAQLRVIGMDWPVLDSAPFPAAQALAPMTGATLGASLQGHPEVPEWARALQVDINMRSALDPAAAKEDFIRYAAAAMFMALEQPTAQNYQGIALNDDPATPEDESLNRQYLSWQFALNLADYRDGDNIPTFLEWPAATGHYLFGVTKQPFFTEAYAYLTAGDPATPTPDKWFTAIELYVPPYWNLDDQLPNLYFQPVNPTGPELALTSFTMVTGGQLPSLNAGAAPNGVYLVFCGPNADKPAALDDSQFYKNDSFNFPIGGEGWVELIYVDPLTGLRHVLDISHPSYTGGPLAAGGTGFQAFAKNPGVPPLAPDDKVAFSLRRSTKGWRFTTGWQEFNQEIGLAVGSPGTAQSLGQANPPTMPASLDDNVPESVWPGRAVRSGASQPANGFAAVVENSFADFDSPADISRMFVIGPVNRPNLTAPFLAANPAIGLPGWTNSSDDVPATFLLAKILAANLTSNPDLPADSRLRVAAGRVDFAMTVTPSPDMGPWTWKLLDLFTTESHLFDGVDNNGNGPFDLADPTEGYAVLNRLAGRININTAPASVLRSLPYMSLLPTSPEYIDLKLGGTVPAGYDPAAVVTDPLSRGLFWDFATAIIARRERRPVPLRLPDATGTPTVVAIADYDITGDPPTPTTAGPLQSASWLANLRQYVDTSANGNNSLFRIDRFGHDPAGYPNVMLLNHKVQAADPDLGAADVLAPDFRYRAENGLIDYAPTASTDPRDAAGVRGRDIYLSRLLNLLTVRSDVFTAYIVVIDEDGHYVQRSQVTLDRSPCFRETAPTAGQPRTIYLPESLNRSDTNYSDDTK